MNCFALRAFITFYGNEFLGMILPSYNSFYSIISLQFFFTVGAVFIYGVRQPFI